MGSMVSARVPDDLRARGNAVLEEIGATTTELVRAAYEYVIAENELPRAESAIKPGHRTLTPEMRERRRAWREGFRLTVKPEYEHVGYDEMRFLAMRERFPEYLGDMGHEESRCGTGEAELGVKGPTRGTEADR